MSFFEAQSGNFNYAFNVTVSTGTNASWSFSMGYLSGADSLYEDTDLYQYVGSEIGNAYSVSQSNDYLFIGNPESGLVEVFQNPFYLSGGQDNTFEKINRLTGYNVSGISGFGEYLKTDNSFTLVGAPFSNGNKGATFAFFETLKNLGGATGNGSWNQESFLTGYYESGYFGSRFDLIADGSEYIAAISATGEVSGSGCVYLYDQSARRFLKKIDASGEGVRSFGKSVGFCEIENVKYLAIGYDQNGTGKLNTYKESYQGQKDFLFYQQINSNSSHSGDMFAYQIDGFEDKFLVSAPNENETGAVHYYLFNNDIAQFKLAQKITKDDNGSGNFFGKNISFDGEHLVVTSNKNSGIACIYYNDKNYFKKVDQITGSNNLNSGTFGGNIYGSFATSLLGDVTVIGSSYETGIYYFSTGDYQFDNITGISFSGSQGKLYDSDGHFLYGYQANEQFAVSGSVQTGSYNVFIEDHLYNGHIEKPNIISNWFDFEGTDNLSYYDGSIYTVEK